MRATQSEEGKEGPRYSPMIRMKMSYYALHSVCRAHASRAARWEARFASTFKYPLNYSAKLHTQGSCVWMRVCLQCVCVCLCTSGRGEAVRQTARKWEAASINNKLLENVCIYANCTHVHNSVGIVRVHMCESDESLKNRPGGRYLCETWVLSNYLRLLPTTTNAGY